MRSYTICLTASLLCLHFWSTSLHAEFSDTQVALFIQAKDIKSLFSKRPKDLSSFITDLDTILVQLKEKAATPTRLTLIAQQLTRYQKLTAILKRKPFEYLNYKHFVRLLQQHASLQRQYRQLLRERQQKRTQLPSREIAAVQPSSDKKDPQKSIVVLSAKISLIRSRMDDLDRVLLAGDRSFFEKHSDKLALGAVATVVLVWLWMNGYLNGLLGIQGDRGVPDLPTPQPHPTPPTRSTQSLSPEEAYRQMMLIVPTSVGAEQDMNRLGSAIPHLPLAQQRGVRMRELSLLRVRLNAAKELRRQMRHPNQLPVMLTDSRLQPEDKESMVLEYAAMQTRPEEGAGIFHDPEDADIDRLVLGDLNPTENTFLTREEKQQLGTLRRTIPWLQREPQEPALIKIIRLQEEKSTALETRALERKMKQNLLIRLNTDPITEHILNGSDRDVTHFDIRTETETVTNKLRSELLRLDSISTPRGD